MAVELDDAQVKAVNALSNGKILCGEVGSGKSRTALAYYFKENGGYLMCLGNYNQKTLIGNDYDDGKMVKNPLDLYIITTAKKRDDREWEAEMLPFLISTGENKVYNHKVVVDSWNNIKKYVDVKGAFFIFDEQRVVGYGTWTKSFLKIAAFNRWILLSATPGDQWKDYIPVFIANGFYRNKTEFNDWHVVWNRYAKYPKIDRYVGEGRLIAHRNAILVKMPVKKITKKHRISVDCGYKKDVYDVIFRKRWDPYENRPIQQAAQVCYLLRKVVNSDVSRQQKLMELMLKHKNLIIFYNFDYELAILRTICDYMGRKYWEWNGKKHEKLGDFTHGSYILGVEKTENQVENEENERKKVAEKGWIYLVQYAAGCEGWNCIETNVIIFYSQSYSYRQTIQAEGRIDRRNTPFNDLYYYYLRSNSSIDISIKKALNKKENFNELAFI